LRLKAREIVLEIIKILILQRVKSLIIHMAPRHGVPLLADIRAGRARRQRHELLVAMAMVFMVCAPENVATCDRQVPFSRSAPGGSAVDSTTVLSNIRQILGVGLDYAKCHLASVWMAVSQPIAGRTNLTSR